MEKDEETLVDIYNIKFKATVEFYGDDNSRQNGCEINNEDVIRDKEKFHSFTFMNSPAIIVNGEVLSLHWLIQNDLRTFWKIKRGNPERYGRINLHNLTVRRIEISKDFRCVRLVYSYRYTDLHGMIGIINPEYEHNEFVKNHYYAWTFDVG